MYIRNKTPIAKQYYIKYSFLVIKDDGYEYEIGKEKYESKNPFDIWINHIDRKDVDKIVIGVESLHQLKQIVSAINNKVDTCKYEFLSINDSKYVNPSKWKY